MIEEIARFKQKIRKDEEIVDILLIPLASEMTCSGFK